MKKTGDGPGGDRKKLTLHEGAPGELFRWLQDRQREGKLVDLKS